VGREKGEQAEEEETARSCRKRERRAIGGGKSRIVRKGTRGKREGMPQEEESARRAWEGEYGKGERRVKGGGGNRKSVECGKEE
jgi:hypothetical protein